MSDGNPFVAFFNEHADFGVQYGRTFSYLDSAGTPIDMSAWVGHLTIRLNYDTPILLTLTATGLVGGTVAFSATGTQMKFLADAQFSETACVYDVVMFNGSSPVLKLVRGSFTLHPTATA